MASQAGGLRARLARLTGISRTPREDVALSVVVTLFAGLLWWETRRIPPPFFDPLGSAAVPRAIAISLTALAVVILLRALLAMPWPPFERPAEFRPRPDIAIGIFLLCTAYVGAMSLRLVGFEIATIAFLIAAAALLGRMRWTTIAIGVVSALVIGIGGTWLFTRFFYIDLPR